MAYWRPKLGLWVVLACVSTASAQQLNREQVQIIKDTADSICNTVRDAKGTKSDVQIQGDVRAQLSGLLGKVVDVGGSGKGSLSRQEFEGLSQEATAAALAGDRGCRERVFNKMFDKLGSVSHVDRPALTAELQVHQRQIEVLEHDIEQLDKNAGHLRELIETQVGQMARQNLRLERGEGSPREREEALVTIGEAKAMIERARAALDRSDKMKASALARIGQLKQRNTEIRNVLGQAVR